jgi:hypothetical protein
MHEHEQQHSQLVSTVEMPSCCGTGCAVCVLDEYVPPSAVSTPVQPTNTSATLPPLERTQCCNTGCLICVRDYPELLAKTAPETQTLQLLEAIEMAQQAVESLPGTLN